MGSSSLLLTINCPASSSFSLSRSNNHQYLFQPKFNCLYPSSFSSSRLACNINRNDKDFFNEDGVVEDMDAYLNYLSLEYDSVWDTKPSWCQPWSIVLTGVVIVAFSWVFLHSLIISAGASFLICTWWYIFLYSYPKEYSNMIAERRKRVTSGDEDTFGLSKSQ